MSQHLELVHGLYAQPTPLGAFRAAEAVEHDAVSLGPAVLRFTKWCRLLQILIGAADGILFARQRIFCSPAKALPRARSLRHTSTPRRI